MHRSIGKISPKLLSAKEEREKKEKNVQRALVVASSGAAKWTVVPG